MGHARGYIEEKGDCLVFTWKVTLGVTWVVTWVTLEVTWEVTYGVTWEVIWEETCGVYLTRLR